MEDQIGAFVGSTLRLAMPLMLAATGELVSQRAGVLNLSLEGMMLLGAFGAALSSWATGDPVFGVVFGILCVVPLAAVQGLLSVRLRANQLVVGIGINILVLGLTTLLYRQIFGPLSREVIPGFSSVKLPFLSDLPVLGTAFFQQVPLFYFGLLLIGFTYAVLKYTSWGLTVKAVGEDPRTADQAGISIPLVRFVCILFTGVMAGAGGAFLSIGDIHTFTENMTNGAGYIAIVAVIFGGWAIGPTIGACILFGAATALQFKSGIFGVEVPTAALLMLPYVLALLAVAGVMGRSNPPANLTVPYERGR
jgi:general nucleoside transport system permease protein